jgi:FimV-like protein
VGTLRARIDLASRLADIDDPVGAEALLREVIAHGGPELAGPATINLANHQWCAGDPAEADLTYRSILNHPNPDIADRALSGSPSSTRTTGTSAPPSRR